MALPKIVSRGAAASNSSGDTPGTCDNCRTSRDHVAVCFAIASATALLYALLAHLRGDAMHRTSRIAFGAFLCPALWFVFFAGLVTA